MKYNLLLWKWSEEFSSPRQRQKAKLDFKQVTDAFKRTGSHEAIGRADIDGFIQAINDEFGRISRRRNFRLKRKNKCVVVSYDETKRIELVPKLYDIAKRFNLNAAEFL